jgi:hypothetical protein
MHEWSCPGLKVPGNKRDTVRVHIPIHGNRRNGPHRAGQKCILRAKPLRESYSGGTDQQHRRRQNFVASSHASPAKHRSSRLILGEKFVDSHAIFSLESGTRSSRGPWQDQSALGKPKRSLPPLTIPLRALAYCHSIVIDLAFSNAARERLAKRCFGAALTLHRSKPHFCV